MKKNILIYSGHGEIVGGDVKYIVDLLNNFNTEQFNIKLFTDRDCHFEKLSQQWLKVDMQVHYLDTLPYVFKKHFPANLLTYANGLKLLDVKIKGHSLLNLIDFAVRLLSLFDLRCQIHNYLLFRKLFKSHSNTDVFFFNNGGYPAKYAGIVASMAAKHEGIKKTVMAFHNVPIPRRVLRLFDIVIDLIGRRYIDQIIAVSHALREDLVRLRGYRREKIFVAYCGLDDMAIVEKSNLDHLRSDLNLHPDFFTMIIAGNLNERRKGHEFLLRSLALVKKENSRFQLLIVGDAYDHRLEELKSYVREHGLEEHTVFLGQRFDIHELNSLSDLAIIPSLAYEATPYTIKESYRAYRPVITTSIGGCAEAVLEDETGHIVAPNDEVALSDKILSLMNSPEKRKQMGSKGRELFLDQFEMRSQQKKVEGIILSNF